MICRIMLPGEAVFHGGQALAEIGGHDDQHLQAAHAEQFPGFLPVVVQNVANLFRPREQLCGLCARIASQGIVGRSG